MKTNRTAEPKRMPIQVPIELWRNLNKVAGKEQTRRGRMVTPAQYAREIISRHLNRKLKQKEKKK